ncbi:MAG TPA: L-threonylcarbamoyladenylate synthase [Candidatus Omnitrophota bacterium]|nr:L-threonylcarbamoyladenylate synthase [Candidatus Omnitrophota bacterium]
MKIMPSGPDAALEAAKVLNRSGTVVFRTETVYGLGALPDDENAVKRLYDTKKRSPDKPLQILVKNREQVELLTSEISKTADQLMEKFWPGPLTLVFKKAKSVPDIVSANGPTVGLRMPDDPFLLVLIGLVGPIASTSANLSGQPDPKTADEIKIEADLLIDGGPAGTGRPSTVIDVSSDVPKILRQGDISPF